jgi:LemA protein
MTADFTSDFFFARACSMSIKHLLSVLLSMFLLSGCGYNQIQINDEQINASWSEVLNQYKRRADLIPNLVQVVQGYAAHEKEVLTRVTEARANVAGMKVTPELVNDPEAMARFQKAQGELSGACRACWWYRKTIRT